MWSLNNVFLSFSRMIFLNIFAWCSISTGIVSSLVSLYAEMGWCTSDGDARSLHFRPPFRYAKLSAQDKGTTKHVYRHVHVLPFNAQPEELAVSGRIIPAVVRFLYLISRTLDRPFVACKGGNLEKNLLQKLNIPAINLEWFGCPRADQLGNCELTCGFTTKTLGIVPGEKLIYFSHGFHNNFPCKLFY